MNEDHVHFRGRYLNLLERAGWEFASRNNASGVVVLVAVTDDRELLLVRQFRIPVGSAVIELPAGLVGDLDDPDEGVLQAAARELEEETGYRPGRLETLMSCPSSAGMSDEIITFVLCTELRRTGPGGGDASEDIEVIAVTLDAIDDWLDRQLAAGRPLDPKIYSALYWLARRADHAET